MGNDKRCWTWHSVELEWVLTVAEEKIEHYNIQSSCLLAHSIETYMFFSYLLFHLSYIDHLKSWWESYSNRGDYISTMFDKQRILYSFCLFTGHAQCQYCNRELNVRFRLCLYIFYIFLSWSSTPFLFWVLKTAITELNSCKWFVNLISDPMMYCRVASFSVSYAAYIPCNVLSLIPIYNFSEAWFPLTSLYALKINVHDLPEVVFVFDVLTRSIQIVVRLSM